jgi:hypothetical protein
MSVADAQSRYKKHSFWGRGNHAFLKKNEN